MGAATRAGQALISAASYSSPCVAPEKGGDVAKGILLEEFHLTVRAPPGLPDAEYDAIRLALDGKPFRARLRRAARRVFGKYPALSKVRVKLSR